MTSNTDIYYLDCYHNYITELTLPDLPQLGYFDCSVNNLSTFTLSGCDNLYTVKLWGNPLEYCYINGTMIMIR